MELATLEMPREQAAVAFKEYRHAVRAAKTATLNSEDAQIARAYKALADGNQVVDINEAFRSAGYDNRGLPRLAISRADHKQVVVVRAWLDRSPVLSIRPSVLEHFYRGQYAGQCFDVPFGPTEPPRETFRSIVPNIPPHLRPPHALTNYHLLWEPVWMLRPRPPGDPALLKHLGGPLYAVLAVGDLTPIEQAVLSMTRSL